MLWNWFGLGRNRDAARFIFVYRDGTCTRRADPVAVERALIAVLGAEWRAEVSKLGKSPIPVGVIGEQADAAQAEWEKTQVNVLKAIQQAFDVQAFTDNGGIGKPAGLTEVELFGLLEGYIWFCGDLIRLAAPFVNAQPRASPSPAVLPPANGAASTSAATPSQQPAPVT